jgi:hypothetical protein
MVFVDDYGEVDKCTGRNVVCNDYCWSDYIRRYNGTCEKSWGSCHYTEEECIAGCDNKTAKCREDPCLGPGRLECLDKCDGYEFSYNGTCNTSWGKMYCQYETMLCPNGCTDDGLSCRGGINGEAYYVDENNGIVRLKNAKIAFEYTDENGVRHEDPGDFVWTDENGRYSWDKKGAFSMGSRLDIVIYFMDSGNKTFLVNDPRGREGIGVYYMRDIASDDVRLRNFSTNLEWPNGVQSEEGNLLRSYGRIYLNTLKAVEFKEKALGFMPTTRERVSVYSDRGTSHLGEVYAQDFPYEVGMRIHRSGSDFDTFEAPTNREYHEYCHHIQAEVLDEKRLPPGADHGGYYRNPSSEWGFIEGWAEYCALEIRKYRGLGGSGRGIYELRTTVYDIELDYRMDSKKLRRNTEEIAIAGILLDLVDSPSDYGGIDDDSVTLPLSDVWKAVSEKFNMGDGMGKRHVYTLRDFYLAIDDVTASSPLVYQTQTGSVRTNLDEVFISHGAFQDANENGVWDEGEVIGFSGKGGSVREDLEAEPGTEVIVEARDKQGNLLKEGVFAVVSVDFEPPNDYLSYSFEIPLKNGTVAIPAPPEEYNATITITAKDGRTRQLAETSFVTSTHEVYENIDPEKPFGTYAASIDLTKTAGNNRCLNDDECEEGYECTDGACEETTPGNCCCLPLLPIMLASLGAIAGKITPWCL